MNIQVDANGKLRHLLTIEGINRQHILALIERAKTFLVGKDLVRDPKPTLDNKIIANLFFEPSTRTRCSFELAAKRLGATVINVDVIKSSVTKGEALLDTAKTLLAMGVDGLVIRHYQELAPEKIARELMREIAIINAGDGQHAHPTQALLDMMTIQLNKGEFEHLSVAIVGDIAHSRVARSDVQALATLGVNDIRIVGPESLIPEDIAQFNANVFHSLEEGIRDADVVIALRIQHERIQTVLTMSDKDYFQRFGLNKNTLGYAKPDALIMHPGPINRDVEIATEVADGPRSLILDQVRNGVAMRMAVMETLLARRET